MAESFRTTNGGLIVPCLWFDDQAEEAARFYTQTFSRGRIGDRSYYPSSGENPGGKAPGSLLTVDFELEGQRFTALNGGPVFSINPSISFFVHVEGPKEADQLFAKLAEGGKILMPVGSYPWSERYGWVQDRFGVSWQVMAGQRPSDGATIVPSLMFSDARKGRAFEAIQFYTAVFPGGRIEAIDRYAQGEGPTELVKHGRFVVAGQELVAMDSYIEHGFSFNEGLSLQVMCKDQSEVDRYWDALSEGGETSVCGWLRDRFGVSWQIVPTAMADWMASSDTAARDRAFAAMLKMTRLDIATLQRAFNGG